MAMDKLSVLFVGFGMLGDFFRPYGYQRTILGSAASLVLRGHDAAILELMWKEAKPFTTHIELLVEGSKVKVRLIRAVFRRHEKVASRHGLFFYVDSVRTRLSREFEELLLGSGLDYVICGGRIPWFLSRHIARVAGAKLLLRPPKVELMDLPGWAHEGLSASAWMYAMFLYTIPLAHMSDWVLSVAPPDERLLRRFLVRRHLRIPLRGRGRGAGKGVGRGEEALLRGLQAELAPCEAC